MVRLLDPAVIGLLMLFVSVIWMLRDESDKSRPVLVFAIILNLFYGCLLTVAMGQANSLQPWKYDFYLYRVDLALGFPARSVALAFRGGWRVPLNIVYELLLPMMIIWLALHRKRDCTTLVLAYVAEMITGPALYMVLPACGPAYAFGEAWLHPANVGAEAIRLSGMPNAFPSLHVATAFVLVLLSSGRLSRGISVAFLIATALATLTTGEHYVIDLVAGLSFGCFAAAAGRRKLSKAATYLAITFCWSLAIRFCVNGLISHPGVLFFCASLTVASAIGDVWIGWRGAAPVGDGVPSGVPGVSLQKEPAG